MNEIDTWPRLLGPACGLGRGYTEEFAASMRARRLTFGDRVHCPFLRPFFLTESDESRMRVAPETLAALGERVVAAAMEMPSLFNQLGLTEAEAALVRLDPGYQRA